MTVEVLEVLLLKCGDCNYTDRKTPDNTRGKNCGVCIIIIGLQRVVCGYVAFQDLLGAW